MSSPLRYRSSSTPATQPGNLSNPMRFAARLLLIAIVVGASSLLRVEAQVTVSTDWHTYAVLGLNSVEFTEGSIITGNVYAGRNLTADWQLTTTGNVFSGGNLSYTFFGGTTGNVAANGSVTVSTVTGNAVYGTTITGTVLGTKTQATNFVPTLALPPPTTFAHGVNNIASTGALTLSPGAYGDLTMTGFGDLNLSSGTYYFKSFSNVASGTIRLNLSNGPVRIYVTNDLSIGTSAKMAVTGPAGSTTQSLASDVLWESHGNATVPSDRFWTNFIGTLFTPYGKVTTNFHFNSMYGQVLSAGPASLGGDIIRAPSNLLSNPNLLLKGTDATVITGGTINVPVSVTNVAAAGSSAIDYSLNVLPISGSSASMTSVPTTNSIAQGATQNSTLAITSTQVGTNYLSLRAVNPTSGNDLQAGSFQLNVLNHAQPSAVATPVARVMLGSTASATGTLTNGAGNVAGLKITNTGGLSGATVGDLIPAGGSRVLSKPISTAATGPVSATGTVELSDDTSFAGATALDPLDITLAATVLDNRRVTAAPLDLGFVHLNGALTGTVTLQSAGDDDHFTRITVNNAAADVNGVAVTGTTSFRFGLDGLTQTRNIGGTIKTLGTVTGVINLTTNAEAGVTGTQVLANVPVSYTAQAYSGKAAWNIATGSDWNVHPSWRDTQGTVLGGAPGVSSIAGDTATFGNSIGALPATITLNGTSPSLASLTFDNNLGGSFSILPGTGGALTVAAAAGSNAIAVNNGAHRIGTALTLTGSSTINVAPTTGALQIDGPVTSTIGLTKIGPGTLTLSGNNTIAGPITITGGTLVGRASSLTNTISNNAALVFDQPTDVTYAGSMTGAGTFAKSGAGKLTLAGADTLATSGAIEVQQGTLTLPFGAPRATAAISVQSQGTLEAAGSLPRAISGAGTVTALGDLLIGRSAQPGQFNQGGASGVGGTLNIDSNAVVILASDEIVLGSSTRLAQGGSLTTLHGARLGNPTSIDATKILSASGNATINSNFTNNGTVNGPAAAGAFLEFTQSVHGAGSMTGNVAFLGNYSPGNSLATVSLENAFFSPTSKLALEIAGTELGQFDRLHLSGQLIASGSLAVSFAESFTASAGQSFDLLDWNSLIGTFSNLQLPPLAVPLSWNTSQFYTTGALVVTDTAQGDWNRDGQVNAGDIRVMLAALTNLDAYKSSRSLSDAQLAAIGDFNASGTVENADLQGFLNLLASPSGGSLAPVPEPNTLALALAAAGGLVILSRSGFGGFKLRTSILALAGEHASIALCGLEVGNPKD